MARSYEPLFVIIVVTIFSSGNFFVSFADLSLTSIEASKPTHYFYTPTPYINPPYNLVIGFHEISISLPARIQLQASLFDNIGRINLGAKYGIAKNLSIGAGMAHSIVRIPPGVHGIPSFAQPRFGTFLCYGPILERFFEIGITPHLQLGDRFSAGLDIGCQINVHEMWSFIFEIGNSIDTHDNLYYLNVDGGLRINPTKAPFLFFDLGIDLSESPVSYGWHPPVSVFFDVLFTMDLN